MSVLWFDGGETGDLGPYGGSSGSVAVTTAQPRSGLYSLAFSAVGSYVFCPSFSAISTVYIRTYVRLHALSASITGQHAQLVQPFSGSTTIAGVNVITDANGVPSFSLTNYGSGSAVDNGTTILTTLDTWHMIELKVIVGSGVSGTLELRIDGVVQITWSGINTGTTNVGDCYFTFFDKQGGGSATGTVYHDDMQVRTDAYPGPGSCRKVQATATTPNYNTWTKVGGTNINNVWDDTPFNATTNATQATSGNKQSGVMDVTGFLNSGDTVNAVKIGWVGKTSSVTTDGADSAIFRTPAGGGGVDTTNAGVAYAVTDAYQEVYFTGITASQIRSCEAGISKGTGTNTHTVEDLWLMVDFTSLTPAARIHFQRKRIAPKLVYRPKRIRPRNLPLVVLAPVARAHRHIQPRRFAPLRRPQRARHLLLWLVMLHHAAQKRKARNLPVLVRQRRIVHLAPALLLGLHHPVQRRKLRLALKIKPKLIARHSSAMATSLIASIHPHRRSFIKPKPRLIPRPRLNRMLLKQIYPDPIWSGGPPPAASTLAAILAAQRATPPQATALGAPGGIQVVQPQTIPGSPIRFSEPANFAELTDRLNRAMALLQDQLKALQTQINAQGAAISPSALAALVATAIGGGQAGSQAIAQGPVPGGPSPIPPYIKPHSLIVGEGSTPVNLYTLNDGQILIGCTGNDPIPAVIQGEGAPGAIVPPVNLLGIQVNVGCNQIQVQLTASVWNFLLLVASILSISPPG